MKLGRRPRPPGAKFLRLESYVTLPTSPPSWDGTPGAWFAMYGNDRFGDCTAAAIANLASMQAAAEGGPQLVFFEQDVIDFYFAMTGGRDEGAIEVDVLGRIAKQGFPANGTYRLPAWAGVEHGDREQVRAAAAEFTGLYVGASLPDSWQQGASMASWDVSGPPNPDNGHALIVVKYDDKYVYLATWGDVIRATWAWWEKYVDESYVLLDAGRFAVDVLGGKQLLEDAQALARETGAGG